MFMLAVSGVFFGNVILAIHSWDVSGSRRFGAARSVVTDDGLLTTDEQTRR